MSLLSKLLLRSSIIKYGYLAFLHAHNKAGTFSGGEPFCQAGAFAELADRLKQNRYEVAAYSGWTFEELCEKAKTEPDVAALLQRLDVLVDGRFVQEELSLELKFRGSRNQRILDVPASLAAGVAVPKNDGRWN